MKKLITLLFIGGFSIAATAQFSIGPRVGANYSVLTTDQANKTTTYIPGFHGGVEMNYKFLKQLSVQLDALFSVQGGIKNQIDVIDDGSGLITTNTIEDKTTLNYVQVPLMINYEIPIKKKRLVPYRTGESKTSLRLYAGGYFAYGLSGTTETTFTTVTKNSADPAETTTTSGPVGGSIVVDGMDYEILTLNPIDFGVTTGAGLSFDITEKNKLFVDLRYTIGFGNIFNVNQTLVNQINETNPNFTVEAETSNNQMLQLSLAYTVSLSNKRYANR